MKKYLCFLLSLTLVFAMVTPAFAAGIEVRDLMDYMFDKNVDPFMYSGTIQSFLSFESDENGIYTLRSADNMEDMLLEISVYLSQFDVTKEEVEPYVRQLHEFFDANPDLFTVFCGYMLNYNNIVLPFTMQEQFEEQLPGINSLIRDNFYCETFFLNVLSSINDRYYEEKNDAAFIYYNDEIRMKSDAMDYADFFENNDSSVNSAAASQVENMLSLINSADFAEKSAFAEYMILMGIMSLNMDDSSFEEDETVTSIYDEMAKIYAAGTEDIKAFYTIDSIIEEYVPLVNAATTQNAKNKVIYEAMSKAATLRVADGKNELKLTDGEVLSFAALSAQQVRNKLVEKNITVSKVQPFEVRVLFENGGDIKLSLPKSGVSAAKSEYADRLSAISSNGSIVVNLASALESDAFSGSSMEFEILLGDADALIPTLSKYAQGNNVYKIKAGAGNAGDVVYFEKDVAGAESQWAENKVYKIGNDGERELVDNYVLEGSKVSFEIGDGQYFVKIDGELQNFDTVVPTPTPTTTPTPVYPPSEGEDGGYEGDYEDEEVDTPIIKPADKEPPTSTPAPVTPAPSLKVSFSDVADSHWAKSYIEEFASKGILSGMGNNMFKPDDFVTREQFAKILAEAFKIVNNNAESSFADVEKGSWYEKYVASVYDKEIAGGIGGNMFGVGQNMTRQDMAVMIVRAAKALGIDLGTLSMHSYNDEGKIADYAKEAVSLLVGANVVSGFEDNTFRPTENCTRAQVAKIVSAVLAKGK